jgi:hypothetical protein
MTESGAATVPRTTRDAGHETLGDAVVRKATRLRKFARRCAVNAFTGGKPDTRVVFIIGAQRSGTRVPLAALEGAPDVVTYREGARPYFRGVHLAPEDQLDRLIAACLFPVLVLKPLCESHRATELLGRFPESRLLWMFRGYQDTVASASLKWSSGIEAVERIVEGRLQPDDWRGGGLTPELLEAARRMYEPALTLPHANAILWYLRTRVLLDLDLFANPAVLVVKYEDLTTDPNAHFPRLFRFIGEPMKAAYLAPIRRASTRRVPALDIPRTVADACAAVFEEVDRRYRLSVKG